MTANTTIKATQTGGPAFPSKFRIEGGSFDPIKGRRVPLSETEVYIAMGMSLRDYFAAQALPAVTADCLRVLENEGFPDEKWRDGIANEAYKMADAMLRARQQPTV